MAYVFISHARQDLDVAEDVRDWLRTRGHRVFLDRDLDDGLRVGDPWKGRLHGQLRAADAVICIVTADYVASEWCIAEMAIADYHGSRLLPLQVTPSVSSKLLADRQHVEYGAATEWRQIWTRAGVMDGRMTGHRFPGCSRSMWRWLVRSSGGPMRYASWSAGYGRSISGLPGRCCSSSVRPVAASPRWCGLVWLLGWPWSRAGRWPARCCPGRIRSARWPGHWLRPPVGATCLGRTRTPAASWRTSMGWPTSPTNCSSPARAPHGSGCC